MVKSWPGYLPPLAALVLTLLGTGLTALAGGGSDGSVSIGWLAVLMPVPLATSVCWGLALWTGRPLLLTVMAAAAWLVISLTWLGMDVTWPLAGNVAAGLVTGFAMARTWRIDFALLGVTAVLLPAIIWSMMQMPLADQLQIIETDMLELLEQNIPSGATEADRAKALETETRAMESMMDLAARIYPWILGLGLLGQAAIILGLTGLVLRRLGLAWVGWRLPPFTRWRLPFYLVWIVVAGVGLMLTRAPVAGTAGLNLALLAGTVICIQGLSVQFFVTGRMMGPAARTVYWLVMGVFFPYLILASGIVLGLVDQWWDIRRLGPPPESGDGNPDGGDDLERNDDGPDEESEDSSDNDGPDTGPKD
jgi:uncharacterized protein YybS (DUF2232 family)